MLLSDGRPFRVASDLSLPPIDGVGFLEQRERNGTIETINGGGDCLTVGGHFGVTANHSYILRGLLPPMVHIASETDKALIRSCLERMMQELRNPEPGGYLIAQNLACEMLIQALRLHLEGALGDRVGWLYALADPQVSRSIRAIHDEPSRDWSLHELAERAGMSRSVFAERFKAKVGESALHYLTHWRMRLAVDRLITTDDLVSEIADSLGYRSESAFSAAFKRECGCPPRQYRPSARSDHRTRVGSISPGYAPER